MERKAGGGPIPHLCPFRNSSRRREHGCHEPFLSSLVVKDILKRLFDRARKEGPSLDYVFTLVRVDGIDLEHRDPVLLLRDDVNSVRDPTDADALHAASVRLAEDREPLKLVWNLLRVLAGEAYQINPAFDSETRAQLGVRAMRDRVSGIARTHEMADLAVAIEAAYSDDLLSKEAIAVPQRTEAVLQCQSFVSALLDVYFECRLGFRKAWTLYKLPQFDVLELLLGAINRLHFFGRPDTLAA